VFICEICETNPEKKFIPAQIVAGETSAQLIERICGPKNLKLGFVPTTHSSFLTIQTFNAFARLYAGLFLILNQKS